MAIARHAHRESRVQSSRRLRSGVLIRRLTTNRVVKEAHEIRRRRVHRSSSPVQPSNRHQGIGFKQPCTVSEAGSTNHRSSLGYDLGRDSLSASGKVTGHDEPRTPQTGEKVPLQTPSARNVLVFPHRPLSPPDSPQPTILDKDNGGTKQSHLTHNVSGAAPAVATATSSVAREGLPDDADDIGLPEDGIWDHDASYQERFCFDHGEPEWLLGTPDRWMRPRDFTISGAEAQLEAKLQEYNRTPWGFQARSRLFQAECSHSLWYHMDVPIKEAKFEDEVVYLIRWKVCWTPESNINDMQWVRMSYKANNTGLECRRSARIESTATDLVVDIGNLL